MTAARFSRKGLAGKAGLQRIVPTQGCSMPEAIGVRSQSSS